MFTKTDFTETELQQVEAVKARMAELESYARRFDAGETLPNKLLQGIIDSVLNETVPMAERLGMHAEQTMMQDTCVRIGYPEDYKMLKKLLSDSEVMCEVVFKTFKVPICAMLDDAGIEYDFQYRMKSVYSIWRKMRIDQKEFDDVYDLFGTRIVYKVPKNIVLAENVDVEKLYCYRIYNIIAMLYRIHPDRIKDWVANPKPSGYQALQFTVMGPDCNWIEIQLRSERMDYEAEQGVAAHWLYKDETAKK